MLPPRWGWGGPKLQLIIMPKIWIVLSNDNFHGNFRSTFHGK